MYNFLKKPNETILLAENPWGQYQNTFQPHYVLQRLGKTR